MDNKLLIIWGNESSFFLTNIKEKLKENKIEMQVVSPNAKKIDEDINFSSLILFYVSDDVPNKHELLIYLRDLCLERGNKLLLLGSGEQLDAVSAILNDSVVLERFARPFDVKVIVEKITYHLEIGSASAGPAKRKHILVVDDSPITLRTVKGWFENKYTVSMASSAALALTFLAKNKPDIILLDYEMPLCSGPQFMQMLQGEEDLSDIPVIFLTSKNDVDSVEGALNLKPAGYLLKTMNAKDIQKYVENIISKL